ncbi:hypothetical protein Tco_0275719 [Tanacetum coccineum]
MTGNKANLAEYQDFNGGPVAFGGSKGYITGKDTECLVLSPEFKLPDENQVLLRIPRQNNMYSFNLENIVPSGGPQEANHNAGTKDNIDAGDSEKENLMLAVLTLLLPTLFILWLATVSTDSANLVPLGKLCTTIETLKKNTAKALISLSTTITLSNTMVVLESCPKHNMVAYLEKTDGNAEFHDIIDFLTRSSIHHALTVSPVVSTTFVEQFWTSAKSKIINNVRHITAKVAGKPVSISEASIRSDLLFDDANGIDSLPNQAIFDAIQLMGYEGDLTVLTFNKALFSPQWRFLFHTMNHCISSKSTSWDQIPTNIATAVICLTSNQKYNFSKLIFDGMLRHLDAKKKFVMYPRFISIFLDKQLANVPVPLDHFPVNALTSKVFSFMVKKGKHFSGKVTPLFASMLVQPTEDEGAPSERPSEAQPTPSPTHTSEVSGGNHGGQSSSDKTFLGIHVGDHDTHKVVPMFFVYLFCVLRGRKAAKVNLQSIKDPLFDALDEDVIDNMDTVDAQICGEDRRRKVTGQGQRLAPVSPNEGSEIQTEARSATPITLTTTPTMFGDDETIAQVLLNMSQAKAVSREKEKGVELKDGILNLRIFLKLKRSLSNLLDEEMARKLQEDWETEEERKRLAEKKYKGLPFR